MKFLILMAMSFAVHATDYIFPVVAPTLYVGDTVTLGIHGNNFLALKVDSNPPILLNNGQPFTGGNVKVTITSNALSGHYKIFEYSLKDGSGNLFGVDDYWVTDLNISNYRTDFGPSKEK